MSWPADIWESRERRQNSASAVVPPECWPWHLPCARGSNTGRRICPSRKHKVCFRKVGEGDVQDKGNKWYLQSTSGPPPRMPMSSFSQTQSHRPLGQGALGQLCVRLDSRRICAMVQWAKQRHITYVLVSGLQSIAEGAYCVDEGVRRERARTYVQRKPPV